MARKRKPTEFAAEQPTAAPPAAPTIDVLERGAAYFLYRPAVAGAAPHGVADVRRFHLALRPDGRDDLRLIVIGHKKLPDADAPDQRFWGFVDVVGDADGIAEALAGSRPAGEGAYALVRHHGHVHLAYALALPTAPGEVQAALNIAPEASYLLVAKNPKASSPPGIGLDGDRKAELPAALQARFGDRRFIALDPPELLDHVGLEVLLLTTDEDLVELGAELDAVDVACRPEDVLAALRLAARATPVAPLVEGEWA